MVTLRRFAVFLCLASLCLAQQAAPKRRKCPDTIIRTVDAKPIKISQYRGKVVMVVMFLTSCGDCAQALQLIQKIQDDYASQGLQVLGVSLDESAANLLPFRQRYRFTFPLGHLEKAGAIELAGLAKDAHPYVPLIMFVDWQGYVRFQYQGNDQFFKDPDRNLRAITTGLLKQATAKQGPQYETRPASAK